VQAAQHSRIASDISEVVFIAGFEWAVVPAKCGGVTWELIELVEDVDRLAEYNWGAAVWQFLVDALGETKEKMCTLKNLQINEFAMLLQAWRSHDFSVACPVVQ